MTPSPRTEWLRYLVHRSVPVPGSLASPCWEWTGALNPRTGRPQMKWEGTVLTVARWALWRSLGRDLKPRRVAAHQCDNKRCVHPGHLAERTESVNMQEWWYRGRPRARTLAAASD